MQTQVKIIQILCSQAEPTFVTTESNSDGNDYKIPLEEFLKGDDLNWLFDTAKGKDAARVQAVGLNAFMAQEAGKEYLEDPATIGLLEMLLEKYPVNESQKPSARQVLVHERRVRPAIRGFATLGTHHSNHTKQQKPQLSQAPDQENSPPSKVYKVSDISEIANIRAQIANDYGEKVAKTMTSVGAYKAGVEDFIKEGMSTVTLQGNKIIGGHLKFTVSGEEVYFRVSVLPKGRYQVSDISKIANIRAQIANDYGEKVAETMASVSAYKAGVEKAIREGKTAVILQGKKLTNGYLAFSIAGGVVRYGIVQYERK